MFNTVETRYEEPRGKKQKKKRKKPEHQGEHLPFEPRTEYYQRSQRKKQIKYAAGKGRN